jgi:putative N-acetyltransferase (TIGR04045 family)
MTPPAELEVRWADSDEELAGALELREEVFCREQGVPREEEIDGRDGEALHVVALDPVGGTVLGTLRVLIEGPRAKIGRVAVRRPHRRAGIASRMLALALVRARSAGCEEARLAAQTQARSVYQRVGFEVCSEPFEEAGIAHVWMRIALEPLTARRDRAPGDGAAAARTTSAEKGSSHRRL